MSAKDTLKLVILTGAFTLLGINLNKGTFEELKNTKRLEEEKNEVTRLQNEKSALEREIDYKKTDSYIEEIARNDLNMIKPGEKVFVVVEPSTITADTINDQSTETTVSEVAGASDTRNSKDVRSDNLYKWYRLFAD